MKELDELLKKVEELSDFAHKIKLLTNLEPEEFLDQLTKHGLANEPQKVKVKQFVAEWSGNHHYILVNKSELISMIEDLDELELKNYLRDIKSQIEYLRIHGPGKIKSLRMLQNMVDNMITGCWSSTSIRTQKVKARLAEHWNEDIGNVLWWNFPVEEPPYCGTPLDEHFPSYKTHFTQITMPDEVEEEPKWKIINDKKYCLTSIEAGNGNSLHWAFDSTNKRPILFDNEETALYTAYITGGTVVKAWV